MSMDMVDDLHAAEDRIGVLEQALRSILQLAPPLGVEMRGVARDALASTWCRPSCVYDADDGWLCGDDCGCPADHSDHWGHAQ